MQKVAFITNTQNHARVINKGHFEQNQTTGKKRKTKIEQKRKHS